MRISVNRCIALAVIAFSLLFTNSLQADEKPISLEKVPKSVLAVVRKQFPKAEMISASREETDGKIEYEVVIKSHGKKVDVTIEFEPGIKSLEKELSIDDLHESVRKTLKKAYPGANYKGIEAVYEIEDGKEELEYYEIQVEGKDKAVTEVKIDEHGKIEKDDSSEEKEPKHSEAKKNSKDEKHRDVKKSKKDDDDEKDEDDDKPKTSKHHKEEKHSEVKKAKDNDNQNGENEDEDDEKDSKQSGVKKEAKSEKHREVKGNEEEDDKKDDDDNKAKSSKNHKEEKHSEVKEAKDSDNKNNENEDDDDGEESIKSTQQQEQKVDKQENHSATGKNNRTIKESGNAWTKDFSKENLVSIGKNPFFVLEPGFQMVLEGDNERLVITVLDETKTVDGVETRIIEERETKNDKLIEVSRNYFAINKKTNAVYYFGEEVDMYKDGKITSHEGSWESGKKKAKFGMMHPGLASTHAKYYQEQAPGEAMDRAAIVSLDEVVSTPAGKFKKCMKIEETTPLEPGLKEYKFYAPEIGLVQEGSLKLVRFGKVESKK